MEDFKINQLIGMSVRNIQSRSIGVIESISGSDIIIVNFHGNIVKLSFPSAFTGTLEVEDPDLQDKLEHMGLGSSFEFFKRRFHKAIYQEKEFVRKTGGKRYLIFDGEQLNSGKNEYLYAFDTDTDLRLPDGTPITIWFPDNIINGYVVSCEDFTILIRTTEFMGKKVNRAEFTSDPLMLMEAMMERLDDMNPDNESLAYELACNGKRQVFSGLGIQRGQNKAFERATTEGITFIWGPPGTGKTETLANVAMEHINNGRRVLMLSYSNVSVDGAAIRVYDKSRHCNFEDGDIIRYGYPKDERVLEHPSLSSYQVVLRKNPNLAAEYDELKEKKKSLKRKDTQKEEINQRLNTIRKKLAAQEKELVHNALFVATTVSKATIDRDLYTQKFDVVIFDEASMAYVPQIIFAASLARDYFICLGDFKQLPAIVQGDEDSLLAQDIFDYTGIYAAVAEQKSHRWLVMLDIQYRMHPDLADFVSTHMYYNLLTTAQDIIKSRKQIAACDPCPTVAMSLLDLSGMYSVCAHTSERSRFNILSAFMCMRVAEKNLDKYEVGIITPYSGQSRLIMAMIRDLRDQDDRWKKVICATVHQFQGSEKPIIIYDAVDCFRMPYPGMLLTAKKNDQADRLFNVALTRAKGKFIMIANVQYLRKKKLSRKLLFSKCLDKVQLRQDDIQGDYLLDEMMPAESESPLIYIEDREVSWTFYLKDIEQANKSIRIEFPDVMQENDNAAEQFSELLLRKHDEGVDIRIRVSEDIDLLFGLDQYVENNEFVMNPITIVDDKIIWFGQPLYDADFISEHETLRTQYFPCVRFIGEHTTKSIKMFLQM